MKINTKRIAPGRYEVQHGKDTYHILNLVEVGMPYDWVVGRNDEELDLFGRSFWTKREAVEALEVFLCQNT